MKQKILSISDTDKEILNQDLEYFFSNDLLFIGKYENIINPNGNNKPPYAIKNMLKFKLQPAVRIKMNKYFNKKSQIESREFPSIPVPVDDNYNDSCKEEGNYRHAVNLRKWTKDGIEFKNSWSEHVSNKGNFSVQDLKYLMCVDKNNKYVNDIEFVSLMFYYEKLSKFYKNRVNTKLCSYWKTFNDSLETVESINYTGSYNQYGLFDGIGKFCLNYDQCYDGAWVNGFKNGKGKMTWSDGNVYDGDWVDDKPHGKGIMTWPDGITYDGDWVDDKRCTQGKMTWPDKTTYEGDWDNDKINGKGIMTWPDGITYKGYWINNERNEKGNLIDLFGKIIYDGKWKNDMIANKLTDEISNKQTGGLINSNYKNKYLKYNQKINETHLFIFLRYREILETF
jgi:hypothetical protein